MLENVRPLSAKMVWLIVTIVILGGFQLVEQIMSESSLRSVFRYERELIVGGEYYRLLTAHLVHLNWAHLGVNVLGLSACYLLLDGSARDLAACLVLGMLVISAGLFLFYPQVQWYAGYSGVLYGQILYGLLAGIMQEARRARQVVDPRGMLRLGLLGVAVIYFLFRIVAGIWPSAGSNAVSRVSETLIGAPVLHEAHMLGAIAGLLAWSLLCLRKTPQT
ncbi:rhombosortase [Allohahella marinimesophila]|uniref:Peptidase S54 rhomboid domain-containing protein n=1 Tax=Allohahella marinimesophila TaxID=1054972 RepID=A0ABP7NKY6_9GAMM